MRFVLKPSGNIYNLMRRCGYYLKYGDGKTGESSFVRRPDTSDYPRFHAYTHLVKSSKVARETPERVIINLHLDQKKPIYKGTPAHSGEHKGELVEREAERIKKLAEK